MSDASGLSLEDVGDLPLCGCGCPDEVLSLIRDILEEASKPVGEVRRPLTEVAGGDAPVHWLAVYAVDQAGLLEHGTSCRYSWLTDKGRRLLDHLRSAGCEANRLPGWGGGG